MRAARTDGSGAAAVPFAEIAAAVSALQLELAAIQSRMRESEAQNESLRETIVQLTHENQLLKRRLFGNKTERTQTSADKRLPRCARAALAAEFQPFGGP